MKRSDRSPVIYFTIGIAALFLAGFFLLVSFGASTYRDIVDSQGRNNQTRALLGYLSTCARANDTKGAISVEEAGGRVVLVIADGSTGYAFRIYQEEGVLVEDYGRLDSEIAPDMAMVIGETALFQVEEREGGIVAVRTDAGEVLLHSRCEQGQ